MTESHPALTHGEGCECVRCTGFPAGNDLGVRFEAGNTARVTHGAHALLLLRPRADELACGLREAMGETYEPRFEAALAGVAMVGAQLERAMGALADVSKPGELARLDQDARGWMRLWLNGLSTLGLTPASAARLHLLAPAPSLVVAMQREAS